MGGGDGDRDGDAPAADGRGFLLEVIKMLWNYDSRDGCTALNELKTTGMNTLKG